GKVVVCGSLPYHLTSPILFHLLDQRAFVRRAVLLLQREVAERVAAEPGGREYGVLSVLVQHAADAHIGLEVGRHAFTPPPEVEALPARDAQEPVARERIAFAAVLDSGPGKLRVEVVAAVHEEGARLDLRSGAEGALLIAGPDRRGEAVRRIVHQADRVVV